MPKPNNTLHGARRHFRESHETRSRSKGRHRGSHRESHKSNNATGMVPPGETLTKSKHGLFRTRSRTRRKRGQLVNIQNPGSMPLFHRLAVGARRGLHRVGVASSFAQKGLNVGAPVDRMPGSITDGAGLGRANPSYWTDAEIGSRGRRIRAWDGRKARHCVETGERKGDGASGRLKSRGIAAEVGAGSRSLTRGARRVSRHRHLWRPVESLTRGW